MVTSEESWFGCCFARAAALRCAIAVLGGQLPRRGRRAVSRPALEDTELEESGMDAPNVASASTCFPASPFALAAPDAGVVPRSSCEVGILVIDEDVPSLATSGAASVCSPAMAATMSGVVPLFAMAAPFSGVVPRSSFEASVAIASSGGHRGLSWPSNHWASSACSSSSSFPATRSGGIPNGFYGLPRNVAVEKALLGFVGFMARAGRVPEEFLDSICARLSACFATASPTMREDLGGDPREVDFVEVIELEERIRNWTEIKFSAASSCRGFGANHVFVLDGVRCEIDLFSAQLLATMKSILSKFDVRMLVQFTKSMQDDDVRGVGCGVGPLVLAGEGRPPVPSGVGRSFRLGNGKVILLSEFALLSMQERHAAARRPGAGSCYQCGSRLLNIFECERCIVAEAAFSSVSGGVASGLRGPCDEDELLAAKLERQYEDLDNNSSRSGAPGSSVWGAHGSVVVALSRDDVESSSASRAGPLSRCADPPGGSEVDESEAFYMNYVEFRALSAVAGSLGRGVAAALGLERR